jgi:hypothetical protein
VKRWQVESLTHERVTNPNDLLSQLSTVLENYNVNRLVFHWAAASYVNIVVLEEGQSFSSSSSEKKFLQSRFLVNFNGACYVGNHDIVALEQ